ncbi:hypothetical protein ADEAN_000239200 [Angomonas deanei]|uniref:Uncharacterized protein n=1 Tax=Angomonas deanei TaxID=59799 RepID=A0A7G2C5R7_9TRYP|nr:hypothetical protein ADEAN_000239200 [Angomonas deanei]
MSIDTGVLDNDVSWTFVHQTPLKSPSRGGFPDDASFGDSPSVNPREDSTHPSRRNSYIKSVSRRVSLSTERNGTEEFTRRMRIDRAVVEDRESAVRHRILGEEADEIYNLGVQFKSFLHSPKNAQSFFLSTPRRVASNASTADLGLSDVTEVSVNPRSPRGALSRVEALEQAKREAEQRVEQLEKECNKWKSIAEGKAAQSTGNGMTGAREEELLARIRSLERENAELTSQGKRHWRLLGSDYMAYV